MQATARRYQNRIFAVVTLFNGLPTKLDRLCQESPGRIISVERQRQTELLRDPFNHAHRRQYLFTAVAKVMCAEHVAIGKELSKEKHKNRSIS